MNFEDSFIALVAVVFIITMTLCILHFGVTRQKFVDSFRLNRITKSRRASSLSDEELEARVREIIWMNDDRIIRNGYVIKIDEETKGTRTALIAIELYTSNPFCLQNPVFIRTDIAGINYKAEILNTKRIAREYEDMMKIARIPLRKTFEYLSKIERGDEEAMREVEQRYVRYVLEEIL